MCVKIAINKSATDCLVFHAESNCATADDFSNGTATLCPQKNCTLYMLP